MELKVLGSVSPRCKLMRNCPGYLITSGDRKILLDCGNGISRYLNVLEDFNNLTIFISHLHSDHYLDLGSIAYESYIYHNLGLLKTRIKVYYPSVPSIEYKMKPISEGENYLEFIPEHKVIKTKQIGNMNISFSISEHNIIANYIKVREEGTTLVYSGDTGYSENLIEFSKNADLLLCESTFLAEHYKNGNNHLYAYEAAKIASKANVKELMLTHMHPDIDRNLYLNEARSIFKNTTLAEENTVKKIGVR